jgi:capsular exopolysaccharide synthesis family protein
MRPDARIVTDPRPDVTVDLRELLSTVAARKRLIAVVTLVALALAGAYSFTRTPVYTARATVLVRPTLTNPLDPRAFERISMPTEMELVTSSAVAEVARGLMGSERPASELAGRVSVRAPAGTQILEISFSDPDPRVAQQGAQSFAQAYLRFKTEQAIATITQYSSGVQEEIANIDDEIARIDQEMDTVPRDSGEWNSLNDRRTQLETTRLALQNQLATLSTLSADPGEVIQPAELPLSPSSPDHPLNLTLGLLAGLMAGVVLAYAMERLGDRVRTPGALERCLDAPTLGLIPKTRSLRGSARLATIDEPRGHAAEAYRTLRTNLLAVTRGLSHQALLFTSTEMGAGKTTTASNLAVALAQVGRSVVLISADLRYPRLHAYFGMANDYGLAQVLQGTVPLSEALIDSPVPKLKVLPSGPVTGIDEPVELLQSDRMRDVIERCREADFTLIDGPPILAMADSLVLAGLVDGIVLVVNARDASRADVLESRHRLEQVGGRILGGVLNRVEGWRGRGGYGAYDYRGGFLYRLLLPEEQEIASALPGAHRPTRPGREG